MTEPNTMTLDDGGWPVIHLQSSDGATAHVHLDGAHVTSWCPAGGSERLFLSSTSEFGPGKAIRGGVPVIFPQFSDYGPFQRHGFARNQVWSVESSGPGTAILSLKDNPETRALWPHAFACEFEVRVGGNELSMKLTVSNPGTEPFEFAAALHTYLKVDDIASTRVVGLSGRSFRDNNDRSRIQVDHDEAVTFPGEIDRGYFDVPRQVEVVDGTGTLKVQSHGFPDAVVWNPGPAKSAAMKDMEPEGFRRFVCVEAAAIQTSVKLGPGETWSGAQRLLY